MLEFIPSRLLHQEPHDYAHPNLVFLFPTLLRFSRLNAFLVWLEHSRKVVHLNCQMYSDTVLLDLYKVLYTFTEP